LASLGLNKVTTGGKFAIGAVLVVATAILYYFMFYSDLTESIDRARSEEQSLRHELADARQAEFSFQHDLAELAERQQRQNEMSKILPVSTEYPAFLSAIQGVANVSGVNLTAWAPQPEVIEKFYARVPMRLDLEGRYHQIAKFFYGVGQLDRIINMENITMSNPRVVDKETVVKVSTLATAFRALAADEPSKGKGPQGGKP